ncbi:hypothetical protein ACHAQA_002022 [Verticillium albo-atrum]
MTPSGVALSPLEKWAVNASPSQFNALAGAIGGFTSGVVTCPLDVIKTKLQAQGGFNPVSKGRHVGHPKLYDGLTGTARVIWRDEGMRGITIVTNPIWVIKTRLMSQSVAHRTGQHYTQFPKSGNTPTSRPTLSTPWHYNSTLDAARKMYTSEGILSFYSGLTPALLGLTHVAVQFPAYEFLKTKFTGQGMGAPLNGESPSSHWIGVLSASIFSKVLASSATYPHEVIRTRLQTQRRPVAGAEYLQGLGIKISSSASPEEVAAQQKQAQPPAPKYRGVAMTFRTILAEEGWRAFYAGMGTNMMRAVPAATVTMLTYEFFMEQFNHIRLEGRRKLGHEDVPLDASL